VVHKLTNGERISLGGFGLFETVDVISSRVEHSAGMRNTLPGGERVLIQERGNC